MALPKSHSYIGIYPPGVELLGNDFQKTLDVCGDLEFLIVGRKVGQNDEKGCMEERRVNSEDQLSSICHWGRKEKVLGWLYVHHAIVTIKLTDPGGNTYVRNFPKDETLQLG